MKAKQRSKTVFILLSTMFLLALLISASGCKDENSPSGPDLKGLVTTLAGTGDEGIINGSGASASFNRPIDLVWDGGTNLYVVDQGNDRIRRVTLEGVTSSFVGSSKGFKDGAGSDTQFNGPKGIIIDKDKNLFVVDINNYRIRKVTPDGTVSTHVGSSPGVVNGLLSDAQLGISTGITIDKNGNLLFLDYGEKNDDLTLIRKISAGQVTTFVGGDMGYKDGPGDEARFFAACCMVVDGDNNLYVSDTKNHVIRKVSPAGLVTTVAGSTKGFADGPSATAKFNEPYGLALDEKGNLYIADAANDKIRMITPDGVVSTVAGSTRGFADGPLLDAQFYWPTAIVFDSEGILYVTDLFNQRIRKIVFD